MWPRRLQFGGGLVAVFPGVAGRVGPCFVRRVVGFELLPPGGELAGECAGAGGFGGVVADLGVCGLLPGVGFGLGGGAQLAGHVGRGGGLGAFGGGGVGFELAAVHAGPHGGLVGDFEVADGFLPLVLEFGVAVVRFG